MLVELTYHGKVKAFRFPQSWNELTHKQLLAFCGYANAMPTAEQSRVVLLHRLVGVPPAAIALLLASAGGRTQLAQLTSLLNFLYQENNLSVNLQAAIKTARRYNAPIWYGPADNFTNLRWNEFIVADQYHAAYVRTQEEQYLDYLVATLYRPQRPDYDPDSPSYGGDRREDFNQHTLERRVRTAARISGLKKSAAYCFYVGCRNQLVKDYQDIFEDGGGPSNGQASGQNGQQSDWLDFLRHLPSDKFGTLDNIENQYVHTTLHLAYRMMRDAQKIKNISS